MNYKEKDIQALKLKPKIITIRPRELVHGIWIISIMLGMEVIAKILPFQIRIFPKELDKNSLKQLINLTPSEIHHKNQVNGTIQNSYNKIIKS